MYQSNRRMEQETILLLTGCINPNCNDILTIDNVEQRKAMYVKSINWYLCNTSFKIVFCENSGVDITDAFDPYLSEGRLEILTYMSDYSTNCTKGYKEMEILEYMQINSYFINECNKSAILVKITGRLILLNILAIIKKLNSSRSRNRAFVSAYLNGRKSWSDCRFIFFSHEFFPLLLKLKEKINTNYYFEHATTDAVLSSIKLGVDFIYPPLLARVDGIGGGFGNVYNISDKEYCKRNYIHQFRRLLFFFGILPWIKK